MRKRGNLTAAAAAGRAVDKWNDRQATSRDRPRRRRIAADCERLGGHQEGIKIITFLFFSTSRPERQKYAQPPAPPAPTQLALTRCTESALLKNAPPLPVDRQIPTFNLVVGYYLCDDPVPYRTVWTGPLLGSTAGEEVDGAAPHQQQPSITLGQFKQLVAKKGVYR